MPKEKDFEKPPVEEPRPSQDGNISDEDQASLFLEQARQEVKKLAQKEREGEKINRELLSFRMRRS